MERKIVVVAESTPSNALFDPVSPVTYYFVVRLEPPSQDISHDNCPYSVGCCKLVSFLVYIYRLLSLLSLYSIILGQIIGKLGNRYSRLSAKRCAYL